MTSFNRKALASLAIALLSTQSVFAAGFEKSQTWSAAAVGQASAVVGSTSGAEALYFNPAGLESTTGKEFSLNFSPTISKFSGANPYQTAGTATTVDGSTQFSPVGALLFSYKANEKLGIGLGYYVSGGTKAKFENLDYTSAPVAGVSAAFRPTVETNLAVMEAALGAGYEVMPGFRVGAAWRVVMVDADFSTIIRTGASSYVNGSVSDISATRWNGYKLGAQYDAPNKAWGLGVDYRSGVNFIAKGTGAVVQSSAPTTTTPVGDTEIENSFPQQLALGGYTKITPDLRMALEYSFTNYSDDTALLVRGGLSGVFGSPQLRLAQNWKNQHVVRIGFEHTGTGMVPIRFGYAYTSQVTPSDYARSTFASPGAGHAITLGSGVTMGSWDIDAAAEYSFASGLGHNQSTINPGLSTEVPTDTDFKSHALVAHLSGKMHF